MCVGTGGTKSERRAAFDVLAKGDTRLRRVRASFAVLPPDPNPSRSARITHLLRLMFLSPGARLRFPSPRLSPPPTPSIKAATSLIDSAEEEEEKRGPFVRSFP